MSPEALITLLIGAIGTMGGAVALLFRLHLKDDGQRDLDLAAAKVAATTAQDNVSTLVPAVAALTETVNTVDERAEIRYENIQKQSSDQHAELLKAVRRRRQP